LEDTKLILHSTQSASEKILESIYQQSQTAIWPTQWKTLHKLKLWWIL